jgi:hypothetical protein
MSDVCKPLLELTMGFTTAIASGGPLFPPTRFHKMREADEWVANGRQEANGRNTTAP